MGTSETVRHSVVCLLLAALPALVVVPASATPTCTTADLRLGARYLGGAGGQQWTGVSIRSQIDHGCTLYGYPGVSYLNRRHHQVGEPATRDHQQTPHSVALRPSGVASFVVRNTPAGCHDGDAPTPVLMRVYPPDQTSARVIHNAENGNDPVQVCHPEVGPVRSGRPHVPGW